MHVSKKTVSGREIFICDGVVDDQTVLRIGKFIKTLSYQRSERSRPDLPVSGAAAEIAPDIYTKDPFFIEMRRLGEDMFPSELFEFERVYVNSSVHGDTYYAHRDCDEVSRNITVLYYGNLAWHADWGGETLFFNDKQDAEVAVTPRPGRLVVSRGAILHRGGVPSRVCDEQRLTIACKLRALP
jgi:SM-20-related protein